jgi:hypothetical protein
MTVYDVIHVATTGFDAAHRICRHKEQMIGGTFTWAAIYPEQLYHFAQPNVGARSVVIDGNVTLTAEQAAMVNGLMARAKQPTEAA